MRGAIRKGVASLGSNSSLAEIAAILKRGKRFLLMTHEDPDPDGIGSMLALGKGLVDSGKHVALLTSQPVMGSLRLLKGSERIVNRLDPGWDFDVALALDSAEKTRLGELMEYLPSHGILINIDHHISNDYFGDLNFVDSDSSSTGELVFGLMKAAGLAIDHDVAENLFAAIQADTGSFKYSNTTSKALKIAADLVEYGARPWEIARKVMDGYTISRLRLLEMALGAIEFYHKGAIGMMSLTQGMFQKSGAQQADSERLVDYPRFVFGVELAVLMRESGKNDYKFSLRSNSRVNVALLASRFGGGGHVRAAGFEYHGSLNGIKGDFLQEAVRFLDETSG